MSLFSALGFLINLLWAYYYDRKVHYKYLGVIRKGKCQKELSIVRYKKSQMLIVLGIVTAHLMYLTATGDFRIDSVVTSGLILFLGMIAVFDYRTTLIPNRYTLFVLLTIGFYLLLLYMSGNAVNLIKGTSLYNSEQFLWQYVEIVGANLFMVGLIFGAKYLSPKFIIGFGDIKLLAALSFLSVPGNGFSMAHLFVLIGLIAFVLPYILQHVRKPKHNPEYLPLGVAIYVSFIVILIFNGGQLLPVVDTGSLIELQQTLQHFS